MPHTTGALCQPTCVARCPAQEQSKHPAPALRHHGLSGPNEGWSQLQTLPVLRYRRREARLKRQVLCEQQDVAHGNIGRSETARHRYACFLTTGSNVRKRARGHFTITLSACRHEMAHEKAFGFAQSFLGEETDFALFTGSAMRPRSCRRVWSRSARAPGHG